MRSRPLLVRVVLVVLGLLVLVWVTSLGAVLAWERNDEARPVSAIVVLGAAQYVGRPSPVLRARLDHAIALFHRHLAPLMIVTGGRGDGDTTSEAAVPLPDGTPPPPPAAVATTTPPPGISPERLWSSSFGDYGAGNYSLAISGFGSYLMYFPKGSHAAEAQLYIGQAYDADKKPNDAITA